MRRVHGQRVWTMREAHDQPVRQQEGQSPHWQEQATPVIPKMMQTPRDRQARQKPEHSPRVQTRTGPQEGHAPLVRQGRSVRRHQPCGGDAPMRRPQQPPLADGIFPVRRTAPPYPARKAWLQRTRPWTAHCAPQTRPCAPAVPAVPASPQPRAAAAACPRARPLRAALPSSVWPAHLPSLETSATAGDKFSAGTAGPDSGSA